MNLREGTRRLALLFGVVGAIAGGFFSYLTLQPALDQRASHNKFEQLANSDVVQQKRKVLQTQIDLSAGLVPSPPIGASGGPPPGSIIKPIGPQQASGVQPNAGVQFDMSTFIPIPSVVMKGGIKTINWSQDYRVVSIETEDGQTLYPTPAPSAWTYLLIGLFPILGFFIPWGAIRAIVWVAAGFKESSK